ncbi:MAG: succinate dehydrogenase assembly factor 2 [Pseudomonadota bacterium]|nr:succinate dehydrogenase assembly factor 2 [Pseudomonadota bacterium]
MTVFIDERSLGKLKWRCRRGMLENDLFIERFFSRHGDRITPARADALERLMDLSDNDLLDLLLARKEPAAELDLPEVRELLGLLRTPKGNAQQDAHPPANPQGSLT